MGPKRVCSWRGISQFSNSIASGAGSVLFQIPARKCSARLGQSTILRDTILRDSVLLCTSTQRYRGSKTLRRGLRNACFTRKRGRRTVQKVKNYGGRTKYYGFGCRTTFSTEGSFGCITDREGASNWQVILVRNSRVFPG